MQRETRQRKLVSEILMESMDHPDALTVFRRAEGRGAKISLGTVYRTLELLVNEGKALKFYDRSAVARYDAKIVPHHHLICKICGKVEDWEGENLNSEMIRKEIEKSTSFKDVDFHMIIYGICEGCAKRSR
uniref:Transcriptional repressor n=1 Tax=Dictyoglomus thermophilum TaxID=14 RepID=A0A7C3RL04_DICTH